MDESLSKIKINNNLNFNQSDIAALSIDGGMFSEKDIYIGNGITISNTNNLLYEGTIKFTDSIFYGYTGTEWEAFFSNAETTDQVIVSDITTSDLTSTNIYANNIYTTDITSNNFTVATLTVVSDLIISGLSCADVSQKPEECAEIASSVGPYSSENFFDAKLSSAKRLRDSASPK